ncbi:hypothetical protein CDO27_35655 (plasmid) [Sinorhizobium meliloti]|nr:hypothetical protein CDO27_35655 [Sinorhizobium meliloti]
MRFFDSLLLDSPEAAEKCVGAMDQSRSIAFDFKAMSRHLNWKLQWRASLSVWWVKTGSARAP